MAFADELSALASQVVDADLGLASRTATFTFGGIDYTSLDAASGTYTSAETTDTAPIAASSVAQSIIDGAIIKTMTAIVRAADLTGVPEPGTRVTINDGDASDELIMRVVTCERVLAGSAYRIEMATSMGRGA